MSNFMDWGTHIPILIEIMNHSKSDVLELGTGWYSTPILHWMCGDKNRKLVSYENNIEYFNIFKDAKTEWHTIIFTDSWNKIKIDIPWDVVFIDFRPKGERWKIAKALSKNAKFIILHDSQPEFDKYYHYTTIYPLFKYKFDYTKFTPYTTVLSNFNNLKFLEKA